MAGLTAHFAAPEGALPSETALRVGRVLVGDGAAAEVADDAKRAAWAHEAGRGAWITLGRDRPDAPDPRDGGGWCRRAWPSPFDMPAGEPGPHGAAPRPA